MTRRVFTAPAPQKNIYDCSQVHTFDDVIATLQKAIDNCDRNMAINFVTLIDREGRALVKCGEYQQCLEVKKVVEKITGRRGKMFRLCGGAD